jgi:hypothetical protein
MNIPEHIELRETAHGHGEKGMAFYAYADTANLGIRMEARRQNRRSRFIETWYLDALPQREFRSFEALREAALPLTAEEVEARTTKLYPRIRQIEPDSCGNRCRLCAPSDLVAGKPRQQHDTWRVTLAYSWKDLHSLSLCDEHLSKYERDPKGLKAAIEEESRKRIERSLLNLSTRTLIEKE